jgi:hypothetical protein
VPEPKSEIVTRPTGACAVRAQCKGHEFLDAACNETVWKKTTEIITDKGGSIPFEVLKDLLIKGVATLFGVG